MKSECEVSKYYFIYYHGNKYAFVEGNIKGKCKGVRVKYYNVFFCVINDNLSNIEIRKVRHSLLTDRKLRVRKKRW